MWIAIEMIWLVDSKHCPYLGRKFEERDSALWICDAMESNKSFCWLSYLKMTLNSRLVVLVTRGICRRKKGQLCVGIVIKDEISDPSHNNLGQQYCVIFLWTVSNLLDIVACQKTKSNTFALFFCFKLQQVGLPFRLEKYFTIWDILLITAK